MARKNMAGGDEFLLGSNNMTGAAAALMMMGAATNVYDAFSAVMSSPWSTEKFTNDPQEEAMAREYVMHAMIISWGYSIGGAALAKSIWPIVGAAGVTAYMFWLYNRALCRARDGSGMKAGGAPTTGGVPPADTAIIDMGAAYIGAA